MSGLLLFALLATSAQTVAPQQGCGETANAFYGWYQQSGANLRAALEQRSNAFAPELLTLLRRHQERATSGGVVLVPNMEPFLDAQDADGIYSPAEMETRGGLCKVHVASNDFKDPALDAELNLGDDGVWRFSDFVYQRGAQTVRLTVLLAQEDAAAKQNRMADGKK